MKFFACVRHKTLRIVKIFRIVDVLNALIIAAEKFDVLLRRRHDRHLNAVDVAYILYLIIALFNFIQCAKRRKIYPTAHLLFRIFILWHKSYKCRSVFFGYLHTLEIKKIPAFKIQKRILAAVVFCLSLNVGYVGKICVRYTFKQHIFLILVVLISFCVYN